MAKSLFLLRHAKAMPGGLLMSDRDRALADKGIKDAKRLALKLNKIDPRLDVILSSPAVRAISTAQIIANFLKLSQGQLVIKEELYAAEIMTLLQIISKISKKIDKLLIVGHNPGLANFGAFICGESLALSTCSLIRFSFDFDSWDEIFVTKASKFNFVN